ncbi:MAG: response regulator transcription factor [Anaerolineae bacterium]|nr:response regulator transcription factor [Anaerolineae bacterium]
MMIRVILADDHKVVRRGIREFLEESLLIEVVAEAESGLHALEAVAHHQPDVVLLDIQMPAPNGLEVARQLRKLYGSQIGILILTAYDDPPYIRAALSSGANGYVMKTADADDIVQAVQDANEGKSLVTASVLNQPEIVPSLENTNLTEREVEILALAAQGMTNKAIGFELSISDRTVQGHLANIYEKLEVSGRTDATLKAIRLGLITLKAGT